MGELLNLATSPRSRAVNQLRRFLSQSGLREGDRLPAEARLAEEFEVSRITLRVALDQLEQEGLVRRKRNQGCFCAIPRTPRDALMARTIVLVSDHRPTPDAYQFGGTSESVVSGVMDGVSRRSLNFLHIQPDLQNDKWLDDLIGARPRGIAVSCWTRPAAWQADLLARLTAAGIPVATWSDSSLLDTYDSISTDHVAGAADLVRLLAEHGKKRILRMWTCASDAPFISAHNEGYVKAAQDCGLEVLAPVYVEGMPHRKQTPDLERNFRVRTRHLAGYLAERLIGDNQVDAIMATTDCEVFNALAACRLLKRPDIVVTGYDNYWKIATERAWEPGVPFATVDKNNHLLGNEIVGVLVDRIEGVLQADQPHKRLVPQQVVLVDRE